MGAHLSCSIRCTMRCNQMQITALAIEYEFRFTSSSYSMPAKPFAILVCRGVTQWKFQWFAFCELNLCSPRVSLLVQPRLPVPFFQAQLTGRSWEKPTF